MKNSCNDFQHEQCFQRLETQISLLLPVYVHRFWPLVHSWWPVALVVKWALTAASPECTPKKKKKLLRFLQRGRLGVRGPHGVTWRLCLFRMLPPGSVSSCGRWSEICLCCRRGAIYLTALWNKNKSTAQARLSARCQRLQFLSQIVFFSSSARLLLTFSSSLSFPLLDEVIIHVIVEQKTHAEGQSRKRGDLSVYSQASQSSVKVFFSVSQLIVLVLWPLFSAHFLKWW